MYKKDNPLEIILQRHNCYNRDFIWRKNITPYRIMIAEFMLARTKAEQVEPVYSDFIAEYPDIVTLSKAKLANIRKYTCRLGLYHRESKFIDSAKYITSSLNGKFPKDRASLLDIPGIGDYVAGAIMTVCYKKPEFVIDSNIARFINRYYGLLLEGEIRRKKIIINKAKKLFHIKESGKALFSLLDFTALVCKPRNPDCSNCVLNNGCTYFENRLEESL